MITGQDLVEWQLRVASGEPVPKRQDELAIDGWAIEARLYAEDPAKGFLPQSGLIRKFDYGMYARIDTGVDEGSIVTPYYDPMIAKIITHNETRLDAISMAHETCRTLNVWPLKTNGGFLTRLLADEAFRAGDVDTGFIGRNLEHLAGDGRPSDEAWMSAAQWMIDMDLSFTPDTPWNRAVGFRLNAPGGRQVTLSNGGEIRTLRGLDRPISALHFGERFDDVMVIWEDGDAFTFSRPGSGGATGGLASDGAITAPMPGKVTSVEVSNGDKVVKGQRLLTLEAMKMEHALTAPFDGVVAELNAEQGGQVQVDALLARITASNPSS
jgi:3-methylcrotonyl-CoA carboxylase alpha subunit